jgi:two-component system chemotaxis response regulator CheB
VTPAIVMIGASAGGLDAVCTVLRGLPDELAFAVVIVQHRSKESDALCEVLQSCSRLPLHEATDKTEIEAGHVYLAPSDYHLLVDVGHFSLSLDAPEMYSRPSIDVAFETAADSYRDRVVGVVLTGANQDGSRGLRHVVDLGGGAIVQDPETAEVRVMPTAALRAVPEAEVLPLSGIAPRLLTLQPARAPAREER